MKENEPKQVDEAKAMRAPAASSSETKATSFERDFRGIGWFHHNDSPPESAIDREWIQTHTGRKFYPLNPRVEDIDIEDIAHALSHLCRFAGHTRVFYSVAEHAVRVSRLVAEMCPTTTYEAAWGLHHDDSEAYMIDLPRPLKRSAEIGPGYRQAERRLMEVICRRFNLRAEEPPEIKTADTILLLTERRDLLSQPPAHWQEDLGEIIRPLPEIIEPWTSERAKEEYLLRFFAVRQEKEP
jgi:uncharacterized protein